MINFRTSGVCAPLPVPGRREKSEPVVALPQDRGLVDEIGRVLVQMETQFFLEFLFHLLSKPQSMPPGHLAPPCPWGRSDFIGIIAITSFFYILMQYV